jgi:hypothetical protein
MMDSADIIVIVIFDSSRLIYGRNVRCWRQADLPSALSVRDRLPLHSRWMARRPVVRRSIMGFRSLTAAKPCLTEPVAAVRPLAGSDALPESRGSLAAPFHDGYCRRIPDCRFVRRFRGRVAEMPLVWRGRREPCHRAPPENRTAPDSLSARTTRPLPILVLRYAAERFIVTAPPVVG